MEYFHLASKFKNIEFFSCHGILRMDLLSVTNYSLSGIVIFDLNQLKITSNYNCLRIPIRWYSVMLMVAIFRTFPGHLASYNSFVLITSVNEAALIPIASRR